MFAGKGKKEQGTNHSNRPSSEAEINAFLGPGSRFEGRMVFEENMRIDGAFRGEISSDRLLVTGRTAELQAAIAVGSLVLSGRFHGTIKAEKRVELRAPANVEGEIEAPVIVIEDGVVFNGAVRMTGNG